MLSQLSNTLEARLQETKKDEKGFSLIELLVVVLIIGILAAIAIPIFLGQQDQAKDSAAKSDLGNAKIAMISYATDNGGSFVDASTTNIAPFGYSPSDGVTLTIDSATATGFCLEATSSAGNTFHVTESAGVSDDGCQ